MVTTRGSSRKTRATAKSPNYTGTPNSSSSTSPSPSSRAAKKAVGARNSRSRAASSSSPLTSPAAENRRKRKAVIIEEVEDEEDVKGKGKGKGTTTKRVKTEEKAHGQDEVKEKERVQQVREVPKNVVAQTGNEEKKLPDVDVDMQDVDKPKEEAVNDTTAIGAEKREKEEETIKEKEKEEVKEEVKEEAKEEKKEEVKKEEKEEERGEVKKEVEELHEVENNNALSFLKAGQVNPSNPTESEDIASALTDDTFKHRKEEASETQKLANASSYNLETKTEAETKLKDTVTFSPIRKENVSSTTILEKGLMYFFFRPKVSVEHAESLQDVQRSYIVLRPLPPGANLEDGKLPDEGRNRLIAVPKKKLPTRGYEKFLAFVEEPKISIKDLKEKYLKGSSYMTRTMGERTNSPAEPIGEGVYAIIKSENERNSHLAYILTTPETLSELHQEFGLKERGSFILSVRNPKIPAPPGMGIPDPAEFSEEIMNEFDNLKWGALQPKHLDYKKAEMLFIGERNFPSGGEYDVAKEELEKLEDEDEKRVKHLNGTESVFEDLELSRKEFSAIKSTW